VTKRLLLAAGVLAHSCAMEPREPVGLVLITLDTARADRLSPYGLGDVAMPALERLAREGVVFDQATTVAPLTLPAHTSLLTGLLPPRHGVRENASAPLSNDHVTLAEILEARGFRTGAFVGSAILNADRGLGQGFQEYGNVSRDSLERPLSPGGGAQRRGSAVIDDAIRWLTKVGDSPFFLWAHLYDPHRPYEAPEPFASRHDPYVAEIAYADSQIGRLLHALDERALRDRVIVIVTADHGESLREHREIDHGIFLYESVLRVPLIVRAPGVAPRRIADLVRLTDVMPTILDLLRLPLPALDGTSLVDVMRGHGGPELEGYAESLYPERHGWAPLFSLRSNRFKFIDAPQAELYDLQRDPFEQQNILNQRRELAAALQARLRTQVRRAPSTAAKGQGDDELRARLAALGYVAGRAPETRTGAFLPDPKNCTGMFESGRCR
jgi:choline-sulfatase